MDITALKKDVLEVWVPFGEDAEVLIRHICRDDLQKVYKKARKTTFRDHQKTEEFDPIAADKLLGLAAVKDWKGITLNGDPFPCTPENIEFLMAKWIAFARFVNDVCVDLEALTVAEKEQTAKNSSNTSGQG